MADPERSDWEDVAPGLAQKLLYTHPTTGARALLLRSQPRQRAESGPRKLQYHPVNEEFICLDGRFTLEGTHWLTPLTYVFYPAGLVHGFHVDVPDGYEIYLRNSGPFTTEWVESPGRDRPYLIHSPERECPDVIVADCAPLIVAATRSAQLSIITLRSNASAQEGALLVCLPAGEHLQLPIAEPGDYAEIFLLEGEIRLRAGERLEKHGHALVAGPDRLSIKGIQPALVMLNYCAQGLMDELTNQARSLHRARNAFG